MTPAAASAEAGAAVPTDAAALAPRFRRAVHLYAAIAGGIGLLGVAGWRWHVEPLLSIIPGLAPMHLGTSIGLVVAAVALALAQGDETGRMRRIAAAALALYLIGWGAMVLWHRALGLDVPVDGAIRVLFLADSQPGIASAATGLAFLLLGLGFIDLSRGDSGMRHAQSIALGGLIIGVVAIAGYVYDTSARYSASAYGRTALPSAIGFVLLFAAMLLCRPREAWITIFAGDGAGNVLARRVLPVAILLPFVSGWVFLFAVDRGLVPLSFGVAGLVVFSAVLLTGIVWRTAYNVTQADAARRGTARALRRSDHLRSAVFEAVLDPIITLDRDGGIIEANMAARRGLGATTRGGRIGAFFAPDVPPPLSFPRSWDEDAALNRRTETLLRRADGSDFPAEISVSQTWPDGRQTLVLHIRDLTRQKATETQLRQAQKMEAVGQLTGGVAHDFNNLLAIILGNLDLLSDRLDDGAFKDEFVRPAIAAAERGAQLTQRLLAFGRRQSLQPSVTDVNRLVGGMVDMLRRTLGPGVAIRTDLAEAPWPTRIDPGQLENALINLAINARDAMAGSGRLTIATANTMLDDDYAELHPEIEPGAYIRLSIADTGQGMAPEVAARAFEPFFTTKDVGRGTGLGLSMVYGFIRQSGGHIRLYSEPGLGTTVTLYLPHSGPADADAGPQDGPDNLALPAGGGERVLVVEDDPDLLAVTTGMLADLGYRTLTAGTAADALALVEARADIDLLFTDLILPGGSDGIALAAAARARRPALKVVYASGFADNTLAEHAADEPIAVLQKPFRRAELAQRLRQAFMAMEDRPT